MELFLLLGYAFAVVMLPTAALLFAFRFIYRKRNIPVRPRYSLYILIFSFYLFGVFYFTGAGTFFDLKRYGLDLNSRQINFFPFSDPNIDVVAYRLNIVLFMPFGFLLPLIWPCFNKYINVFLAGLSFSALIEISQLLNNRSTDIDDIILNTAGAVLGAFLFKLFSQITRRKPAINSYFKFEAFIYILFIFFCRFFLYDELGLAKILYGF